MKILFNISLVRWNNFINSGSMWGMSLCNLLYHCVRADIREFTLGQHLYVITLCGFQKITVPRKSSNNSLDKQLWIYTTLFLRNYEFRYWYVYMSTKILGDNLSGKSKKSLMHPVRSILNNYLCITNISKFLANNN